MTLEGISNRTFDSADDCVIYRQIVTNEDITKLQSDVDRLGEWAVENAMKINPSKSKTVCFHEGQGKGPTEVLPIGHVSTGSEQLQLLRYNST